MDNYGKHMLRRAVVYKAEYLQNIVLECQAGGSPSPTIYWEKNNVRIQQGDSRDWKNDEAIIENEVNEETGGLLRLGYTKSKLYLGCVTEEDAALYTCAAKSSDKIITQEHRLKIVGDYSTEENTKQCLEKRTALGDPAKIYMWTSTRVEVSGGTVQLFCRAEGAPGITYTWRDNAGNVIDETNANSDNYEVLENGDLVIKQISWDNMGIYRCTASNVFGKDTATTFVYPTN
ncbi:hypothetical protein KUTeg_001235 [Tegillarca granosa]|uniref:Ig-like domain-containing protein n=1 Tax=Tegillarca granosa TaxID=220873 RepID=A0ABQ9FVD8_TEGGR|nr:hypothetical protein KUTeg_001235 [Tegillarca granosa]